MVAVFLDHPWRTERPFKLSTVLKATMSGIYELFEEYPDVLQASDHPHGVKRHHSVCCVSQENSRIFIPELPAFNRL